MSPWSIEKSTKVYQLMIAMVFGFIIILFTKIIRLDFIVLYTVIPEINAVFKKCELCEAVRKHII